MAMAVAEEVAVEGAVVGVVAAAEEVLPRQEDHPRATQEGETTDSSGNPWMCSPETTPRRKSSSRNGSSTIT